MKRRLLALVAAAALLLTFAAAPVAAGNYNGNCTAPAVHPKWIVYRAAHSYTYASAQTVIRQLRGCIGGPSTGTASVAPVNLQLSGTCIIQIGYDADEFGNLYYWATTFDDDNDNWDGGASRMSLGFRPVVGSTDTFYLFKSGSNWELKVYSSAAGTYGYRLLPQAGCATSFDEVWYGIENDYYQDQFGGAESGNKVTLSSLGYKYVGVENVVTWLTGTTNFRWDPGTVNPPICWWEGKGTDSRGYTTLSGFTTGNC
jgi:hypothetical protein